jgi:hypothetical protein
MQGYNRHWAFTKEEDAKSRAVDIIEGIKENETIYEIYTDVFYELYCEISDQTLRVYIEEVEVQ